MQRTYRVLASISLATATLFAAACSSSDTPSGSEPSSGALEKVTYLTSFGQFGRDAYAHVAKEKGFFEEVGLDVTIEPGIGTDNVKALAGGKAQYAAVDFAGGLLQITGQSKADVVTIAVIHERSMSAIMALEESGIKTPKDLEGKTIADLPGSTVRLMFPTYAQLAGFDSSTVKFENATPDQLFGLLGTGKVNAIGQFVVGKPSAEAVTKKKTVLLPYSDYMSDLYGVGIWASRSYANDNPDQVARFRSAIMKGLKYAIEHPDEAAEILKKSVPTTNTASAAEELRIMAPYVGSMSGIYDTKKMARAIALLQGAGAVPEGLEPSQILAEGAAA